METDNMLRLLIVDDRPENLLVLERLLERPGLEIMRAQSGNEALGLVLDYDFALVLLDVQMPDMDGFETAELMRSNSSTKHIPIIFVTAISKDQNFVFKGYESGAVDYLFKPLDTDILQSKVNIFLELYKQRHELENYNRKLEEKNRSITKHKKKLSDTLEKLEISYNDLKDSQKQLIELERKNSILAMAVTANHELNQPLTVIKGYIGMIESSMGLDQISEKQAKYFKKIDISFNRIDTILRNFNETASVSIENYNANKKMFVFNGVSKEDKVEK
jgi:response regulator RpfG family c-di-GMP phosphodiesterase